MYCANKKPLQSPTGDGAASLRLVVRDANPALPLGSDCEDSRVDGNVKRVSDICVLTRLQRN